MELKPGEQKFVYLKSTLSEEGMSMGCSTELMIIPLEQFNAEAEAKAEAESEPAAAE